MSKTNTPHAAVPPHIFESMLRAHLSGENTLSAWKDELQQWSFSAHQLDQLSSELKKKTTDLDEKLVKEILEFIEKKIRA